MGNLTDIESQIKIVKEKLSKIEIKQEFFDYLGLMNKKRSLIEKKAKINWSNLSLEEKIIKRKEEFLLTTKYFEKFKEEVEQKYLFEKNYIQLIDNIQLSSFHSPLLVILLESLNTSIYIDFNNKDFNISFIIEELTKIKTSEFLEIISSYEKVITYQKLV
jgi:hypothetical protein